MVEAAANNELAHTVYNDLGPDPWQCSCGAWNPDGDPCAYIQPWKGKGNKKRRVRQEETDEKIEEMRRLLLWQLSGPACVSAAGPDLICGCGASASNAPVTAH